MPTLTFEMVFFILLLLESEGVITEEQRKSMMEKVKKISQGIPMSEALSEMLDMIKKKKNKK